MKRVLITGATGFIGARLAEVLIRRGIEVVALVRRWGGASRLSRLPVRMAGGDVLDAGSLRSAMKDCDVVMHCAADFRSWGRARTRSIIDGTRTVLEVARAVGVSRVVHLSSTAVHGLSPAQGSNPSETSRLRRTGHDYCDGKIGAERVAVSFHRDHGLPVAILRPTLVYGPFGYYSEAVARAARERRLVLVNGATGVCNCLYVDNLVQAILLAAERDSAIAQILTIADAEPVTWRTYLEGHARPLGPGFDAIPVLTSAELTALRRRLERESLRRRILPLAKRALKSVPRGLRPWAEDAVDRFEAGIIRNGEPAGSPRRTLSPDEEESFSAFSNVTFSIAKARAVLGYEPAVAFEEGMARTADWIRWASI